MWNVNHKAGTILFVYGLSLNGACLKENLPPGTFRLDHGQHELGPGAYCMLCMYVGFILKCCGVSESTHFGSLLGMGLGDTSSLFVYKERPV